MVKTIAAGGAGKRRITMLWLLCNVRKQVPGKYVQSEALGNKSEGITFQLPSNGGPFPPLLSSSTSSSLLLLCNLILLLWLGPLLLLGINAAADDDNWSTSSSSNYMGIHSCSFISNRSSIKSHRNSSYVI